MSMNDIERYNFWHSEMDAVLKRVKEHNIKIQFIDDSLKNLKLNKNIFDFVMGVDDRIKAREEKEKGA